MKKEIEESTLNLLVMTSDPSVQLSLQRALNGAYALSVVPDSDLLFALPDDVPQVDALLIIRASIESEYLTALARELTKAPVPVAIFVQQDPERLATAAIRHGVTSFVVDGFEPTRLPTVIELTIERFKLQQALQNELLKSQEELAARKVIERAKGLLMDKKNLNEQQAYRSLRELAMRQAKPIKEVAETLLLYSDILP